MNLTEQMTAWSGEFGRSYTDRNDLGLEEREQLYVAQFGIGRRELNAAFLGSLAKNLTILEIGCNVGDQLVFLAEMGFTQLTGLDTQNYALTKVRQRLPNAGLIQGSALMLPFPNASFDLVFTSGVLIHIHPDHLATVMSEIYRVTRTWIWGMEYFALMPTAVVYRGQASLLWKAPFAERYQQQFPDLTLVREQRFADQRNMANVNSMYLLRKP